MLKKGLMKVSCAILAGGSSTRMGLDKATVIFNGKALIRHVYDIAKGIFDEVMVITKDGRSPEGIPVKIYRDIMPLGSPMVGILTSLIKSSKEYTFVVACDMPFITEESLRCVIGNLKNEDIVVPQTKKGFEPLHAIYGKRCIPFFLKMLDLGFMKIQTVFPFLEVKIVEDNPSFYNRGTSVFANINTKEELEKFSQTLME